MTLASRQRAPALDEVKGRCSQEAEAASALNHPNLLSIHEAGEADSARFVVMEYVEDETLRQRMAGGSDLREALDVAAQVASALSEAHAAGIVHRDIKPENVMLRRGDIVKVLDFGIAKLTERRPLTADTEARIMAMVNTGPGAVRGTVRQLPLECEAMIISIPGSRACARRRSDLEPPGRGSDSEVDGERYYRLRGVGTPLLSILNTSESTEAAYEDEVLRNDVLELAVNLLQQGILIRANS